MQVIVDKMVEYLRGTTDEVRKADAVKRIADLAEKFAPDSQWYIEIMNQVPPLFLFSSFSIFCSFLSFASFFILT